MSDEMNSKISSEMKHEPDTTSVPLMTTAGLGLLFLVLGAVAVAALIFRFALPDRQLISADQKASKQPLTPGVQPNQAYQRQQLQMEQRRVLNEFYWQNEERGLASVPIEQAITIMAQRELRTHWPLVDPMSKTAPTTESHLEKTQPEKTQPDKTQPAKAQSAKALLEKAQSGEAPPIETQPTEQT